MHSVTTALTALTALYRALARRVRTPCQRRRIESPDESPAQPAMRGLDRFDPETYPPFETVRVGEPHSAERPHGVVVLNDGPKRELSLSVTGAGTGDQFDGSCLLESGAVVRLSLQRPDRYEVTVTAPGRPPYAVEIRPAWFTRTASVTNVRVLPDGYVRYAPV